MKEFYKNLIFKTFDKAQTGCLEMKLPRGETRVFGSPNSGNIAQWHVYDESLFQDLVLKNDIGLGESYEHKKWDTEDLAGLIRWLLINQTFFKSAAHPVFSKLAQSALLFFERVRHFRNRNSIDQSRENISFHYDLGNFFYQSFLDSSMTYSSAFFTHKDQDLSDAQREKYDRICRKINLQSHHHLLEIGTGWGGFAIHAAREYGCKITTTTISKEQYQLALERVRALELENHIDIRFQDYRTLTGIYDRIVSIEMLEAVGHRYLGNYFSQCNKLLSPDGLAAYQVITCPNSLYDAYTHKVDWIRKYIFTGGHLPSIDSITDSIAKENVGWDLYHMESFGLHYAKTLACWREQFNNNLTASTLENLCDSFIRRWNFYLSYCEAGFLERHVNVVQLVFGKPDITSYKFENFFAQQESQKLQVQASS
ncbi:MAG: cyclopropane-fatty-acyl-phospholipid synthase [Verrucomicrobia bacterium]|nr:cyclopropane-fatty-acyl-phospholipid synthase [Verrucomicrobiota bacterium]